MSYRERSRSRSRERHHHHHRKDYDEEGTREEWDSRRGDEDEGSRGQEYARGGEEEYQRGGYEQHPAYGGQYGAPPPAEGSYGQPQQYGGQYGAQSGGYEQQSGGYEQQASYDSQGGYQAGGSYSQTDISRPSYGSGTNPYTHESYRPQSQSTAQQKGEVPQELYLTDPAARVDAQADDAERGISSTLESFAGELTGVLHGYARKIFPATSAGSKPLGAMGASGESGLPGQVTGNRFNSFAAPQSGNGVKWYVDGKDYMYAVSVALETCRDSIWILDWWLSPELYLRRPPSANEQYRLDRMLKAAAERGVKVNIIVYKEVTQALTLDSSHTKHALEDMHINISVFRHPDHLPDRDTVTHDIMGKITGGFKNYQVGDGLKGIYGMKDDVVLYWAHHEKLCIVDGQVAFMGGLDLCFGRWDMNHHPIADVHPQDLGAIVYPGQDYNDARFMDFQHVDKWQDNQVSRLEIPRMGWSDVSMSLIGPTVQDLQRHFVQRWNFIFRDKYAVRQQERYTLLDESVFPGGHGHTRRRLREHMHHMYRGEEEEEERSQYNPEESQQEPEGVRLQIVRSATNWSHGLQYTEHSIQEAYIEIIGGAKHFVYMENQFFITATDDKQAPILNKVGRAIVDRILRAARDGERFQIIVVIPAIPGFAGDLKSDASLGTRAIMEFQYRSINNDRGYSIMEQVAKAGVDPREYIRFYNLRNYDRINTAGAAEGEARSGVPYETAAIAHDEQVGGGYGYGGFTEESVRADLGDQYQRAVPSSGGANELDSVASCVMLGGPDIRTVPWTGDPEKEIEAFVSEELYVHTKVCIADDRVALIGSANMNDRSQLGDHDSEIACIIEDPTPLPSRMNGRPYTAAHFAATLRRQLFRKHLGLIPAQNLQTVDENMQPIPVPNIYDFDSAEDQLVADPLSPEFQRFWNETARVNSAAFAKVFHAVPADNVRTWKDYDEFWGKHFAVPKGGEEAGTQTADKDDQATKDSKDNKPKPAAPEKWGHVVRSEFSPGAQGAREIKEVLAAVRGTLIEMPLEFLRDEDIAKEGLSLNAFTESVYT